MEKATKPAVAPTQCQVRRCLRCRESFESEGTHHRICNRCKASRSWREGQPVCVAHGLKSLR